MTSTDVARQAGVSRGTVFNVLNGDPRGVVRQETAQRVRAAVAQLGYVPSAAARVLRGGRSNVVLVVSPTLHDPGARSTALIEALAEELATRGLSVVWRLGRTVDRVTSVDVDPAVVLTIPTPDDPDRSRVARGFNVPVLPAFPGRDEHIAAAGRLQVEHLADIGVRRLLVAVPDVPALRGMAALRSAAVRAAAARLGLVIVGEATLADERAGWAVAVRTWVDGLEEPLGVCAFNDDVALQVLAGAHDAGVIVPDRLAVIGADDTASARWSVPSLSSVRTETRAFVMAMAEAVVAAAHGAPYELPRLPTDLAVVPRASTGAGIGLSRVC